MGRRRARALAFVTVWIALILDVLPASAASGVSWSSPIQVGAANRTTCDRALAATASTSGVALHAVYKIADADSWGGIRLYYRRSRDNGATWTAPATLTANPSVWKECPKIAGAGSLLVAAWRQGTATAAAIRYRVSTDGGTTWRAEGRLPAPRTPGKPSVAVAGSTITIAWTDGSGSERWSRIAMSRDRGGSWTIRALDAKPTSPDTYSAPTTQVAASGSRTFAAWLRAGGTRLIGRASTDGGLTWQAPTILATTFTPVETPYSAVPGRAQFSIAARPDRMAIAWTGGWAATPGQPQLFTRVFADGAWGAPTTITASAAAGQHPYGYFAWPAITLLAATRVGVAAVVCEDLREIDLLYGCGEPYGGAFHVLWSESASNGRAWTTPVDVNGGSLTYADYVSVVWTSASLRGLLVDRADGEPDWDFSLLFYRGSGLP